MFDLAIRNGMLVTADRVFGGHLYVRNGKIAAISDDGTLPAREELDAAGLYVLLKSLSNFCSPSFEGAFG